MRQVRLLPMKLKLKGEKIVLNQLYSKFFSVYCKRAMLSRHLSKFLRIKYTLIAFYIPDQNNLRIGALFDIRAAYKLPHGVLGFWGFGVLGLGFRV